MNNAPMPLFRWKFLFLVFHIAASSEVTDDLKNFVIRVPNFLSSEEDYLYPFVKLSWGNLTNLEAMRCL